MLAILATLAFAAAACLAGGAILATWTRYRDVALGNLAALRGIPAERAFDVRIFGIGRQLAMAGHAAPRRASLRSRSARPVRREAPRRVAA